MENETRKRNVFGQYPAAEWLHLTANLDGITTKQPVVKQAVLIS